MKNNKSEMTVKCKHEQKNINIYCTNNYCLFLQTKLKLNIIF